MKKIKFKKYQLSFLSSLLLAMTFCVFGPLEIFMSSSEEFWFTVTDVMPVILIAFAATFGVLFALNRMISRKYKWITALYFGMGIALYIQGNFMFANYGALDGTPIDWASFGMWPVINSLIWIALIAVPIVIRALDKRLYKIILTYASAGIMCIQVITLLTLVISAVPKETAEAEYTLTNNGQFVLSEDENTIVFVLDCFDQAAFSAYAEENPEVVEKLFADFTFYPDTVGGATKTVVAVPYIITGQPYISEDEYADYLNRESSNAELYDRLTEKKFDFGFYTDSAFAPMNADFDILNLGEGRVRVGSYKKLTYYTYKLTAFRYLPHMLKKNVWMYTGDFAEAADMSGANESAYVCNDALFYQMLCEKKISVQNKTNAYRLYHLDGAHPPYTLNKDSQRVPESTQFEQISGVFNILSEYFKQMDALGIFDSANIIILADHGEYDVNQNPLFMIKTAKQENDHFTVSEIPVSYSNLHATILEMNGIESEEKSVFELSEGDNAERYFYANSGESLLEFVITGHAANFENVKKTGVEYAIFSNTEGDKPEYRLGTEIQFIPTGTGSKYVVKGFATVEAEFTRVIGKTAELEIPLESLPEDDLYVTMDLYYIENSRQRIKVKVNGQELHDYTVQELQFCFRIPKEYVTEPKLNIEMEMLNIPETGAESILVKSLRISDKDKDFEETFYRTEVSYGDFMPEEIANNSVSGFSTVEDTFVWTNANETVLNFTFEDTVEKDLMVTMDLAMVYAPHGAQSVNVYINGALCYSDRVSSAGEYSFIIPKAAVEGKATLEMRIELPDAIAPAEVDKTKFDLRKLALAFEKLSVEPSTSDEKKTVIYQPNQEVTFGVGGNAGDYVISGFDLGEENHSWTNDTEAYMYFDLGAVPTSDMKVTCDLSAVYSDIGSQNVTIYANDVSCFIESLTDSGTFEFIIPKNAMTSRYLTLCFELPDAVSPYEVNGQADKRLLALDFRCLKIEYEGVSAAE